MFPGRLGTLPVFKEQFEVPIRLGGYKNASNIQVQTATQCAIVLKQLISPYLLRRMKVDVMQDLPTKEEKVLFCKLTKAQVAIYQEYLKSVEVTDILDGKRDSLAGISVLRKICCHPDLVDRKQLQEVSEPAAPPTKLTSMCAYSCLEAWIRLRKWSILGQDASHEEDAPPLEVPGTPHVALFSGRAGPGYIGEEYQEIRWI